jgi:hypothetical protein
MSSMTTPGHNKHDLGLDSREAELLDGMIVHLNQSTTRACTAIDEALAFVAASNRRIDRMETKRGAHSESPSSLLNTRKP